MEKVAVTIGQSQMKKKTHSQRQKERKRKERERHRISNEIYKTTTKKIPYKLTHKRALAWKRNSQHTKIIITNKIKNYKIRYSVK